VSHGNEAGPQLMVVLQGYGITVDMVGDTFIGIVGELDTNNFKSMQPRFPVFPEAASN
jgi:hypothetical protein